MPERTRGADMSLNRILKKLFNRTDSKDIAKKRLQFALIYDKLEVDDGMLASLQRDLVDVITKYFEIDRDNLTLDIQRMDGASALMLSTPILSPRGTREKRASAAGL